MNLLNCNTIDDCIEYGKSLEFAHSKLFERVTISTDDNNLIIANYTSILTRYMDYIKETLVEYTFTDEEFLTYQYKPKMFCYHVYGTMELWSLLLRVNNMISIMDFKEKTIKIFNSQVIFELLNEIMNLEREDMESNNLEIEKKIIEMSTASS